MVEILVAIVGIILTILFGIYTIIKMKKKDPKVELFFSKNDSLVLVSQTSNELGLEINYNGEKITNPIILLDANLKNTGTIDIDRSMILQPLTIVFPQEYNCLKATVLSAPENSSIEISIFNKHKISLSWDLLKKKESLELEIIVEQVDKIPDEISPLLRFYEKIKLESRITNLRNIKKGDFKSILTMYYNQKAYYWFLIFLFYFIMGVSIIVIPIPKVSYDLLYVLEYNNTYSKEKILLVDKQSLILKNSYNNEKKHMSIHDFNKEYSIKNIAITKEDNSHYYLFKIVGILMTIISFYWFKKIFSNLKFLKSSKQKVYSQ